MSRLTPVVGLLSVVGVVAVAYPTVRDAFAWSAFEQENAARAPTFADTVAVLDRDMRESSGLALSRMTEGVFWTHNDSGDGPIIYAFDRTGEVLRDIEVEGAKAVDWEDMDIGPCPRLGVNPDSGAAEADAVLATVDPSPSTASASPWPSESACLYLADTGDNNRRRDVLTVYVVEEPDPRTAGKSVPMVGRLQFTYPDEPHDTEMLAVEPNGDLVFVTKGRTGFIVLFELEAHAVSRAIRADRPVVLPAGRVLPIVPDWDRERTVTGGSFRRDGAELAVRTYTEIFFLPWPLRAAGEEIRSSCFTGRLQRGGESLAYQGPIDLMLTSEAGRSGPGILLQVRCD